MQARLVHGHPRKRLASVRITTQRDSNPTAHRRGSCDHVGAVICVIVEISVAPEGVAQLADDSDKVYAEIIRSVPGFLFGTLGVKVDDHRALGVVYFESAETFHAAGPVIEGLREAVGISPGATFTLTEWDIVVRRAGLDPSKLFSQSGETAAPGASA